MATLRIGGYELTIGRKAVPANLAPPTTRGGWYPVIHEPFTGAWQRNQELTRESVLSYHAVYSCVTLIASDVSKCRLRLVEQDDDGIWAEINSPAFSPVLAKPNRYQNRIKFFEQWTVSKLLAGNTYALKERDNRGIVVALYILDPLRTKPLVAPDGGVYYQLSRDNLTGIDDDKVVVPASEIVHDVMVPLYHPLCGVSPLTASGLAACQGLNMQTSSSGFFQHGAIPSGILTHPENMTDEQQENFKQQWEDKFGGVNRGRVAVLSGGLKFEPITMKAIDAQLIEQLGWTAEVVCSTFHVPKYKAGVGEPPPYQNVQAEEQRYYQQCLQKLFECIELCLDEGLGLDKKIDGRTYGTEFDLDDLLRMDTAALIESETKATGAGIKKIDEARKRLNLPPIPGGDTAYLQQQNYSLEALAKRDAKADPFATRAPTPTPPPAGSEAGEPPPANDGAKLLGDLDTKFGGDPPGLKKAA